MQWLIELMAGFVAMLAAAALSQFGLDLSDAGKRQPEVRRMHDCSPSSFAAAPAEKRAPRDC